MQPNYCCQLPLARTLRLKQNICCVESPVSGSLSSTVIFMAWLTPWLKSPKLEWSCHSSAMGQTAFVYMYVGQYVEVPGKWLHTIPSDPALNKPQGFSWEMLINKQTNWCCELQSLWEGWGDCSSSPVSQSEGIALRWLWVFQGGIDHRLSTCCGSPAYAAPELISGLEYRGSEVIQRLAELLVLV